MRFAWLGWAITTFVACGGNAFTAGTSGSQAPDAATEHDAAAGEMAADGAPPDATADDAGPGLRCGPNTCAGTSPVCCLSIVQGTYECSPGTCGCGTQLDCRRKDDCPGTQVCCITPVTSSACTDVHSLAQCRDAIACAPPSSVLCEPSLGGCGAVLTCKQDAATLQKLGLPGSPADFGVCGT
jgi:hypothetical protein